MQTDVKQRSVGTVDLSGQVAVITGAGSGIGRAMAKQFASAGAMVIVVDLIPERVEQTVSEILTSGGQAEPAVLDLCIESSTTKFAADVCERWERIDVLCNNAGIMDKMQLPADTPLELWNRVLSVNLTAPFLLTRALLPTMLSKKRGCIINTGSEASLRGGAAGIAYTASKHGLIGMTKNIAWAYATEGIRCNAICPGGTATNISGDNRGSDFDRAGLKRFAPVMALRGEKLADPEQMASVALFLASDAASFINGAILPVDNGWSAG